MLNLIKGLTSSLRHYDSDFHSSTTVLGMFKNKCLSVLSFAIFIKWSSPLRVWYQRYIRAITRLSLQIAALAFVKAHIGGPLPLLHRFLAAFFSAWWMWIPRVLTFTAALTTTALLNPGILCVWQLPWQPDLIVQSHMCTAKDENIVPFTHSVLYYIQLMSFSKPWFFFYT